MDLVFRFGGMPPREPVHLSEMATWPLEDLEKLQGGTGLDPRGEGLTPELLDAYHRLCNSNNLDLGARRKAAEELLSQGERGFALVAYLYLTRMSPSGPLSSILTPLLRECAAQGDTKAELLLKRANGRLSTE